MIFGDLKRLIRKNMKYKNFETIIFNPFNPIIYLLLAHPLVPYNRTSMILN